MSFKEYRKMRMSREKLPALETVFGSHAIEKSVDECMLDYMPATDLPDDQREIHKNLAPSHKDKMSEDEKHSIQNYSSSSMFLNSALHEHYHTGAIPETTPRKDRVVHDIANLDSVMNRHKTTGECTVYTGLKKSPANYFRDSTRKVGLRLPAFTSTSTDPKIAEKFAASTTNASDSRHGIDTSKKAQHILKIRLPKGTHAMSLVEHSMIPGEKEILLHRGHSIAIHPIPTHVGNNVYHWEAEIHSHQLTPVNKD